MNTKKNGVTSFLSLHHGGEGETRTPAPVTRPTPLAGAPRHQLEYFSICDVDKNNINYIVAERVGFEPTVPCGITGFQDQLLKPLGHLSKQD